MTDRPAAVDSYLQADASWRSTRFPAFLDALASIHPDEPARARALAAQAVTPLLDYSSLRSLRRYLTPRAEAATDLRLAVLGGPSTIQLVELLAVFLTAAGIETRIFQGGYGLFRQDILTSGSALDAFAPQIVFVATSGRDAGRRPDITEGREAVVARVEAETMDWRRLWAHANERWGASVVQNTFDLPPWGALGHFALRHPAALESYLDQLNRSFAAQAPPFVVLHDLGRLVCEAGAREWFDPRFYLEAKMPCGPECLVAYAHSVASLLGAMRGRSRKVLVLDLDDTLWGGTVGDVGAGGIVLGQGSAEGEAFVAFQQYVKALHARGIILAICSKNDEVRAKEPFEQHQEMVLTLSDCACFVASWHDKAESLREISSRLGLDLDAFVFVDDNPAERALVRQLLPAVAVPDLPDDPAGYIQALARYRYFETTCFTDEDAHRSSYYAHNAERTALASKAADIETFLASLEMTARVEPVSSLNIERVTQLINKSHQFNLTTRGYTRAQVQTIASDPAWCTVTIHLKDRLGDHGLISVLFAHTVDQAFDIDTWITSCRVLQRGVEQVALDALIDKALSLGCGVVTGSYVPSPKNEMVRDHYARLGFEASGAEGGTTRWRLPVGASRRARASAIRVE